MGYATAEKQREAQRAYKEANRESIRAWNREWRKRREKEDPEFKARARANEKAYRARNPEKVRTKNQATNEKFAVARRNSNLKKLYGITHADYERMLVEQGGCCAICGTPAPVGIKKYFSVDHDHETGRVRQLLCDLCNNGLGRFKDDIDLLKKAVAYLERHKAKVG
jgi:hypothetical protein